MTDFTVAHHDDASQAKQFLEILFPEDIQDGDLEIIIPASHGRPGRARLGLARAGRPRPAAPNSAPLISRTGANIGFMASVDLIEAPFTTTYLLEISR